MNSLSVAVLRAQLQNDNIRLLLDYCCAHLVADAGEALDQHLVVVRYLHQLDGAVAVVGALVGLGLQAGGAQWT